MWKFCSAEIPGISGRKCSIEFDSQAVTMSTFLKACQSDGVFRQAFNAALAALPYAAFRWEMPAVTTATTSQRFECVFLDSPGLDREPDFSAFSQNFVGAKDSIAVFENLGKDAMLVVPSPVGAHNAYCHLAAFVRYGPPSQQDTLWRSVGAAMATRLNTKPVWLNTAGAGVPWLHVRLDDRPKYYRFDPYRRSSA